MKNNILDLQKNCGTILRVRETLLNDCNFQKFRDVDTENTGYWVKKQIDGRVCNLGIYVRPGDGISVNVNTFEKRGLLPGAPEFEAVMDMIDKFLTELFGDGWNS